MNPNLDRTLLPIGMQRLLEQHERELEAERQAHQDALALCAHYEQRIAQLKKELADRHDEWRDIEN